MIVKKYFNVEDAELDTETLEVRYKGEVIGKLDDVMMMLRLYSMEAK